MRSRSAPAGSPGWSGRDEATEAFRHGDRAADVVHVAHVGHVGDECEATSHSQKKTVLSAPARQLAKNIAVITRAKLHIFFVKSARHRHVSIGIKNKPNQRIFVYLFPIQQPN
jgi:hypothetical protein